jgi:hypothetical protein
MQLKPRWYVLAIFSLKAGLRGLAFQDKGSECSSLNRLR